MHVKIMFTGSHMVIVLLERGYQVTIFDDLSNACEQVYPRLKVIAGDKAADMRFIKVGEPKVNYEALWVAPPMY